SFVSSEGCLDSRHEKRSFVVDLFQTAAEHEAVGLDGYRRFGGVDGQQREGDRLVERMVFATASRGLEPERASLAGEIDVPGMLGQTAPADLERRAEFDGGARPIAPDQQERPERQVGRGETLE